MAFGCAVWIVRGLKVGFSRIPPHQRNPTLFIMASLFRGGLGLLGGLIVVAVVGRFWMASAATSMFFFGWSLFSFGCLVWIVRGLRDAFSRGPNPPRNTVFFITGSLLFGLALVGGLIFVAVVGTDSVECRRFLQYFIATNMAGCMLV
jgi:hypothetical protein